MFVTAKGEREMLTIFFRSIFCQLLSEKIGREQNYCSDISFAGLLLVVAESKETTLERAAFQAGWSELTWSGRTQPTLT